MIVNQVDIFWFSVGREAHNFVFPGIDFESEIIGKGAIQQAQRVWKLDFLLQFELVALTDSPTGGGSFTQTIHSKYGRTSERRCQESTGSVRIVVIAK